MNLKVSPFIVLLFVLMSCSGSKHSASEQSLDLTKTDFTLSYELVDAKYGTKTTVEIKKDVRVMKTNSLPNHKTGNFPNSGNPNSIKAQNITYRFPLTPTLSGESKWAREPGIALNGVKFEPETAERFVCETGEVYKIEAIQDLLDLGLDHNHAHVQPTGAYHYHGVPKDLMDLLNSEEDIIHVGYAKDGFPMYYSKSGQYKPSYMLSKDIRTGEVCNYRNPMQSMKYNFYNTMPDGTFVSDWQYVPNAGQLDECNGITIDGQYGYFITKEYPYVGRCLKGEFKEERPPGPPPGQHRHGPPPGRERGSE